MQIAKAICACIMGEAQHGEWTNWVRTLRDYYHSTKGDGDGALRVIITNGEWLILFAAPWDSFGLDVRPDPMNILIFRDWQDIESRCGELFGLIEYSCLSKEVPEIYPAELPFKVSSENVDKAMYGLKLSFSTENRPYSVLPRIAVAPIIHLRSSAGNWIRITSGRDESLPFNLEDFNGHFEKIDSEFDNLIGRVSDFLGTEIIPTPLSEHYSSTSNFSQIPGVKELTRDTYQLALGERTHYLKPAPGNPDCQHHELDNSRTNTVFSESEFGRRSAAPRSYFMSREPYFCVHRDVFDFKRAPLDEANQSRCGSRSGGNGYPFCEIFAFETGLCCMTCAYGEICMSTEIFNPPCPSLKD